MKTNFKREAGKIEEGIASFHFFFLRLRSFCCVLYGKKRCLIPELLKTEFIIVENIINKAFFHMQFCETKQSIPLFDVFLFFHSILSLMKNDKNWLNEEERICWKETQKFHFQYLQTLNILYFFYIKENTKDFSLWVSCNTKSFQLLIIYP